MRVRAGAIVSFMNRDRNEKLVIIKLLQPVATPGMFEVMGYLQLWFQSLQFIIFQLTNHSPSWPRRRSLVLADKTLSHFTGALASQS